MPKPSPWRQPGQARRSSEYYVIKRTDVGQPTIHFLGNTWLVENFIGQILPGDVGKRVYIVSPDVLQVENDEQFRTRTAHEALSEASAHTVPGSRDEVVAQAKALGYTQVETTAGWIDLDEWIPYGKRENHYVYFQFQERGPGGTAIRERVSHMALEDLPQGFVTGIWGVR